MAPHMYSPGQEHGSPVAVNNGPVSSISSYPDDINLGDGTPGEVHRDNRFVPMAICGMACRLPGGVNSPQDMWDFIINKKDARSVVPASRYNIESWYSEKEKPGTVNTRHGYFIDNDPSTMDTSLFSMTQVELERTDPQQRQLLELAREVVEDAGIVNWRGSKTGVWVGNFSEDWSEIMDKDSQQYGVHRIIGQSDFALANRISYEMDLQGPSATIRTACAASLQSLHNACLAIMNGDCTAAIVAGASLILTPTMTIKLAEQGALSPDASCKTFSADANGYARAEAFNAIYVKPLADAIRDGNPVRAVIRATATNHDGKTPGITFPGERTQEALIHKAYAAAGIADVSETAFAELHGTGTQAGDSVETKAIGHIFGQNGIYITSIKPNFGHSEGASGLSSLIKAVLALEHRVIPPNIKFTTPNPKIPFAENKLTVPVEPTAWPSDRQERVSINNFGIGGSNVHVILDSAASFDAAPMLEEASDDPQLLLYSAAMSEAVTRTMENHRAYLSQHAERIEDLAYTLATRREHLGHRGFVVASREKPGVQSAPVKPSPLSNIVMVFTGQGAQWPQMGKELLRSNRHFKSTIKAMDAHLKTFGADGPKWTIEAELRKPAKTSQVHLAELSQPLCTAIQVALVAALNAVGVKPAAVVGHSSGEIAAAYAAGALSAEQAITAAFHRGAVAKKQQRKGGMAAIGLSWDDVKPFLVPNVGVACENSAKSVTLSGDLEQVEAVVSEISKAHPNVLARLLKVEKAYHSYHMTEIGEDYYQMVGPKMFGQGLQLPFFSSVTGKLLEKGTLLGSRYWQSNLESPVLFRAAVLEILDHDVGKNALFLEIGPHSALAGPLRQIWSERSVSASYVGTLARGQESTEAWLNMLGKLYTLHIPLDLPALFPSGTSLTDLPRYPWDHSNQKWHETRATKEWRFREYAHHDLLGVRIVESTNYEPVWRNILHIDNVPWVRDHQIGEDILLPFTGYVAMAGEAIRQTTGIQEGFKIRQAAATSALALVEGQPIELISTLRKQRLATSVESDWWEFTVGSHNGTNWTKHFSGEIKAMVESIGPTVNAPELPRQVDSKGWHHASRLAGNVYGPRFQCQENIRSSTTSPGQATGIIKNAHQGDERNFHMHPATMDAGLQLMVVASIFGLTNNFKNQVATSVRELSVSRCAENLTASVIGSVTTNNVVLGSGDFSCNGQVVMRVADFVSTILDNGNAIDAHAAARHIWRADVDFADASELFKPYELKPENLQSFELMTTLCLARARQDIINITPPQYHLQKYKTWIESNIGAQEDYSDSIVQLQKIVDELAGSPLSSAAQALSRVSTSIASLVREEVSPSGVIGMDDSSDKMRTVIPGFDFTDFIVGIAHSRPNLRVLELGAGNGQSAIQVLKQLGSSFSKYTLTDFSSSLFESIKEQFKGIRNVEFVPLDIGLPLEDQGFGDRKFDLIIANNVFHQVADATAGMRNLRQLLHPQGRLLLQEPSRPVWSNFLFGSLPSWWKAADQLSAGQRLDPQSWNQLIAANDLDIHTEKSDSINRILVARPKRSLDISKEITVLRAGDHIDVSLIQARLEERGFAVSLATLESEPHVGRDVVSVLDLTGPFLHDLKPAEFEQLKKYLASVQDAGIFWITKVGSVGVADPRYADVLGFSRSFRNETNVALAVCQTDAEFDSPEVFAAFEKFHSRQEDEVFDSEMEYAVINGKISIGRFYPYSLVNELLVSEPNDAATLAIGRAGRLDGLHWKSRTAEPLGPKDVQIQVYCAGLNHRDVQIAAGLEPGDLAFGQEAAGVVIKTGSGVQHLRAGDRVLALARDALSSVVTASQALCIRLPEALSFAEAATMPTAFSVALYALQNVGNLTDGESVLIHNAASDVGLAAVQIAKQLGAQVYATVDNLEKRKMLSGQFKIPSQHIFDLKEGSFANALLKATNGKGVDVVLNSVTGELLHATWTCVADFGRMIEIGKKDLLGAAKLDMEGFLGNKTFSHVDLDRLRVAKPAVVSKLLMTALKLYNEGHIKPLPVAQTFIPTSVADAFAYLQRDEHIGKVLVELRTLPEQSLLGTDITERRKVTSFESSASYLLVGGLGGLGRVISIWMVERGARNLIYLGRSAGDKHEDQDLVRELRSMGCNVTLVKGSVANLADVTNAVEQATDAPLKGILQMSIVLRDTLLANMTWDDWELVRAPKVRGTWNLHNATVDAGLDLDFFVCFASIAGAIGTKGQTSYAASNTFLDAFVQYRNSLGLAASAIDLAAVEDVGIIAQSKDVLNQLHSQGFWTIRQNEVIDALAVATGPPSPKATRHDGAYVHANTFVLGLGTATPLSNENNRVPWRRDPRMAVYHNARVEGSSNASSSDDFKSFLTSAKADVSILQTEDATKLIATEIAKKLLGLLMKTDEEINISLGLADLGMDSLIAIDMRQWWKQTFGFNISVLEMLGMGTLEMLGQHAAKGLAALIKGE